MGALYARAVGTLGRRGYSVPAAQQASWWTGVLLTAAGLMGPVDALSEDLVLAHMGQHLLIADLAAPLPSGGAAFARTTPSICRAPLLVPRGSREHVCGARFGGCAGRSWPCPCGC